jgi:hypothetical protein
VRRSRGLIAALLIPTAFLFGGCFTWFQGTVGSVNSGEAFVSFDGAFFHVMIASGDSQLVSDLAVACGLGSNGYWHSCVMEDAVASKKVSSGDIEFNMLNDCQYTVVGVVCGQSLANALVARAWTQGGFPPYYRCIGDYISALSGQPVGGDWGWSQPNVNNCFYSGNTS